MGGGGRPRGQRFLSFPSHSDAQPAESATERSPRGAPESACTHLAHDHSLLACVAPLQHDDHVPRLQAARRGHPKSETQSDPHKTRVAPGARLARAAAPAREGGATSSLAPWRGGIEKPPLTPAARAPPPPHPNLPTTAPSHPHAPYALVAAVSVVYTHKRFDIAAAEE